ncbi:hypothetical protein M422DRAFT_61617 [Sphaerobolus stellatus SS14]|uniref:Calcineurin-like phosphoesterase domain-containing protein n=1 Tax=Sphaerobolus stellatus (strain SS14) TaxID=990650 RepID=A0A0C9V351_SPHS4|nr:hypothetical protein M422DRAFT_61617 [Sphaerobolus stellatus SS14]
MSNLHLQFHLRPANGARSGPGYKVFDFPTMVPNLALLRNISIASQAGLFDFYHKQPKRFGRVFFVLGNNKGYNSTYASPSSSLWDAAREKVAIFQRWLHEWRQQGDQLGKFMFLHRTRYDMNSHRVPQWMPEDYRSAHMVDIDWLNDTMRHIRETEPQRQIAIFTHHGPTTRGTLKPEHKNNELSCAFVTEISLHSCWAKPLKMWAFGHTQRMACVL